MRKVKRIAIAALLFVSAALLFGQSLTDDPRYRELIEEANSLEEEAQAAFDEGEYGRAIELSSEAETRAGEAEEYAEQRVESFRARGLLSLAENEVEVAASFDAESRYPDRWRRATQQLDLARNQFSSERWSASSSASREVLRALQGIEPSQQALEDAQAPPERPRYYVVRRREGQRDSFWRIAGYDFVYGDPWKWRELYEANRDEIQDPDNPDLIQPGQRFRIPSIEGEQRAGTWDEDEEEEEEDEE
ncbi:MAG: hypothetical protein ACOC45_04625 [Alkalispirochaetaceae bacterium]